MNVWNILALGMVIASVVIFSGPMQWGKKQSGLTVMLVYALFAIGSAVIVLEH